MIELVLGGARSGKSRYAEQQARQSGLPVVYLATASAGDEEMHRRIERHRQDRPAHWLTVEEPLQLAPVISCYAAQGYCVLVDCLTLWLSNALFDHAGQLQRNVFEQQQEQLLATLAAQPGRVILVSNEVGQGVVAIEPLTRLFVDEAGFLHQKIARLSDRVVWVVAGLPQVLK